MLTQRHKLLSILLVILFFAIAAQAQDAASQSVQSSASPAVTVSVTASGVRFASPAEAFQMRVIIYNAAGEQVYDSGARQGSVLDWKLSDVQQPLADGSYLSVVTVKDFQGKNRQRTGIINVQSGKLTLKRSSKEDLTAAQSNALTASRQSQKVEQAEGDNSVTVLGEGKTRSVTVTAHDGQNGQVTSTSGALTFRTGDVLAGQDKEQMRVTPDGRVGIGTDRPEATLDVAGEIRARGGIRFDDGTVLTSATKTTVGGVAVASSSSNGTNAINVAGTGTTNQLAKWTDNAGTLGNSQITEANGNIGIGTNNPSSLLHVGSFAGYGTTTGLLLGNNLNGTQFDRSFQIAPVQTASPSFNSILVYALPTVNAGVTVPNQFGIFLDEKQGAGSVTSYAGIATGKGASLGATNNTHLLMGSLNVPAGNYSIYDNTGFNTYHKGSVGIGTTTPTQKLEVAGNIKVSGAGNGIVFADGSVMTTASAGGGSAPSGSSIVTAINDPATAGTISDNRVSPNLARINGQNAWTGQNTFVNGLSANGVAITNVGNPVSATDATNKAYVDANTVRFVPGAEQLSVGDANGTAAMINLRGGSTCCSGPGGHTPAWFKVFQNGSFVATGNLGIGVSPWQGKGYRTS
ncbi:MAG: hypothetical protein WCB68_23140, partial [Pyrinomonadaceae bacterium]